MAKIVINVAGESAGVPGVAREFGYDKIDPTPPLVTLTIDDNSGITQWLWEIVDQPNDASAVLSTPTANTATFTPDAAIPGTYLLKCTFNGGASYAINAVAWQTQYAGLRIPAANETTEYDSDKGWAYTLYSMLCVLDDVYNRSDPLVIMPLDNLTAGPKDRYVVEQIDEAATVEGSILYLKSDGHWAKAKADSEGTIIGLGLAIQGGYGLKRILLPGGFFRKDAWSWTPGLPLYVDPSTAGAMTQIKPTGLNGVMIVGIAKTATIIHFNPFWYEMPELGPV